nr:hypothetical protein [uncultured Rhodopila sp.]
MAAWAQTIGFTIRLEERRFGQWTQRSDFADDPMVALCGVDNAEARMVLEEAKFPLVVEAGLGAGPQGYRDWASALSGTDPDVLMKVDPLSAHVFAAISPDQPIFNLPQGNDCFVGLPGPFLRPDSPSAGRTAVNNGEGHRALAWRAASLRAG